MYTGVPLTQSFAVTSAPFSTSNLTQSMYFFRQAIITGVWCSYDQSHCYVIAGNVCGNYILYLQ